MLLEINGSIIPTKEYIDEKISYLENTLINHINNIDTFHTAECLCNTLNEKEEIDTKVVKFDLDNKKENANMIDSSLISTDSQHRFISDDDLYKLDKCITKSDFDAKLNELNNNLKSAINSQYNNILNMKNATNALNLLTQILEDEEKTADLLKLLSSKVESEQFDEHVKSSYHLTKDDRDALDKVLRFIEVGRIDWNADSKELNCIINKPEYLKANGGDADTVKGYSIDNLLNISEFAMVVGTYKNTTKYNKSNVDLYIENDESNDLIVDLLSKYKDCEIKFREGTYDLDKLCIKNNSLIGSGQEYTYINSDDLNISNSTIRDVCISNSSVIINSKTKLYNVNFVNCDIIINNSNMSVIKNCIFNNQCSLQFIGVGNNNNIITENISHRTINFNYVGGNNIITNNISL